MFWQLKQKHAYYADYADSRYSLNPTLLLLGFDSVKRQQPTMQASANSQAAIF